MKGISPNPKVKETEPFREAMVSAYQNGATLKQASKMYGFSVKACATALQKAGLSGRSRIPTGNQARAAIALWLDGMPSVEIAKKIGLCDPTCRKILRAAGVYVNRRERLSQFASNCRKYNVTEAFFDNVSSESVSYVMGFIAADGHVDEHSFRIEIHYRDIDIIRKIRAVLNSDHPVYEYPVTLKSGRQSHHVRIDINSTLIAQNLIRFGFSSRKHDFVVPLWAIPPSLLGHFYRGCFDGDGYVHRNPGPARWNIGLCGSESVVKGFQKWLLDSGLPSKAQPRFRRGMWDITFGGIKMCQEVVKFLYNDAMIFMDRKKKMADELLADDVRLVRRRWTTP